MHLIKNLFIYLYILFLTISIITAQSAESILKKVDANFVSDSRISTSHMVIKGRRITRTIKSKSWIKGDNQAYTEYIAPAREKGTKMLKLKDELWIYTPSSDRIIKIAGHMLRTSLSGSDISYEDFMEDKKLSEMYNVTLEVEQLLNNKECFVLSLKAKDQAITYHSRKLWVDKETYLPIREDRFAKSGRLLKTFEIKEISKQGSRYYPKRMIFKDVLKKGKGTEIIVDKVEFDKNIPSYIFSKSSLRK